MRFITTHTQPLAVKRESIPIADAVLDPSATSTSCTTHGHPMPVQSQVVIVVNYRDRTMGIYYLNYAWLVQNELSKPDLDAKTQKLHLPSFGVCKQPKSEKKSHFTLHTSHFSLLASHSKPHTSHFTLRSSHSKLKLHTPHFTLLTSHCFLHTAHFTLHSSRPTLHTALNLRATKNTSAKMEKIC